MNLWPYPFLLGLLAAVAVAMGLRRTGFRSQRRAVTVFAVLMGVVVALVVANNPALRDEFVSQIALAGLGIVIAILALVKRTIDGN